MIDLTKRKNEPYKIKLEDGTILKLKKPTQKTLLTILELHEAGENNADALDELYNVLTHIFNRNMNKDLTYTKDDIINMLDVKTAIEVLQDYLQTTLADVGK